MYTTTPVSVQLAEYFTGCRAELAESRQELEMLKSLFDACPLPMFMSNPAGAVLYVNQAYLDMLGAKIDDLVQAGWLQFVHPDDRDSIQDTWKFAADSEVDRIDAHARFIRMDGGDVPVTIRICRILNGHFSGFLVKPS